MRCWIVNANVWDDGLGRLVPKHVLVEGDRIADVVDGSASVDVGGCEVFDARGRLLSAGFVDLHAHLREPGQEYKETIATATAAAACGGFTTVAAMPNTRPPVDSPELVRDVLSRAARSGVVRVMTYACITRRQEGRELTDFAALKEVGAIGFTDDGFGVQDAALMKEAMRRAAALDLPIVAHCEDRSLAAGGVVADGEFARRFGLPVIPNEAEAVHIARDVVLAEATGVHYHVCHVSTETSVRLIRDAKRAGIRVTAEVCPHHLVLSEEDIPGPDADWKMNPPLRSRRDVEACVRGLEDGTIDFIATDHAPHSPEEKAKGMREAPFGIVGFETAFPLLYTRFVLTGRWTLGFLLSRLSTAPASAFGLGQGRLEPGYPADLTLIDLDVERTVDPGRFRSKGRNTPFAGWALRGWPVWTMVAGRVVWSEDSGP